MEQSKFYQIKNVTEHEYTFVGCDGSVITRPIRDIDKTATAFTIEDAKDGDVLVASDGSIFIFKGAIDCACKHYVALTTDDVVKFNEGLEHYWETSTAVHPATKKQRDLLFQKLKEAGYEWDADKKELKKIEQKPTWSEEDEEIYRKCICAMRASACGFPEEEKFVEQVDNWFKSLKDRYTWKPSDEQMDNK